MGCKRKNLSKMAVRKMMMKKAAAMKKSMKSMKMAKKAMKSMKKRAMKKSAKSYKTVAGANRAVWSGKITKTKGGLAKGSLMKSKSGKIVSAKKSALGKKNKWVKACIAARKALGVKGFAVIKKGSALYKKAKSLYK